MVEGIISVLTRYLGTPAGNLQVSKKAAFINVLNLNNVAVKGSVNEPMKRCLLVSGCLGTPVD